MPRLRQELSAADNAIIESNSVIRFLRPDLYVTVLDPANADFKVSARDYLDRADVVLLHEQENEPQWENVSLKPVAGKPLLRIHPPQYVPPDLVDLVRRKLAQTSKN